MQISIAVVVSDTFENDWLFNSEDSRMNRMLSLHSAIKKNPLKTFHPLEYSSSWKLNMGETSMTRPVLHCRSAQTDARSSELFFFFFFSREPVVGEVS